MARILLAVPGLGAGGAERVVSRLAAHWHAAGHDLTLLTLEPADADFYALPQGLQRIGLDASARSTGAVQALRANAARLQQLRAAIRQTRPEVLISFTTRLNVLCQLASTGLAVRTVLCERTFPPGVPQGTAWEMARRHVYPQASAICAQTQASADWLHSRMRLRRVHVIPNAAWQDINTAARQVAPDTVVTAQKKLLLAVGRLVREKAYVDLLHAWREMSAYHARWELVILGDGPQRSTLEQLAPPGCHLPGTVGNLQDWYARADLFVHSAIVEGYPNSLLEALARGCAAVATDCQAGPRELVIPGRNGILVPPAKPGELARALAELMGDPDRRLRYAAAAQASVAHLGPEHLLSQWDELLTP